MHIKQTLRPRSGRAGFTLIELIIVIAIIALLAAATFVAVNPAKRIGDANDAQRWADVTAIAEAINLYTADNNGDYPVSLTSGTEYEICIYGATCSTGGVCVDEPVVADDIISLDVLVDDGYIGKLPYDPETSSGDDTNYWVRRTAATSGSKLEVGSCAHYSGGSAITVTR